MGGAYAERIRNVSEREQSYLVYAEGVLRKGVSVKINIFLGIWVASLWLEGGLGWNDLLETLPGLGDVVRCYLIINTTFLGCIWPCVAM